MAIRIVTDSCAAIPNSLAETHSITVAPLYVTIGDESYRDGVDIDAGRLFALLEGSEEPATTSQPSVADFQEIYRRLLGQGHEIVSVHVSSKLSGTLNSARQARESLGAASRIEIVDSLHSGGGQALLALSAARWAGEGSDHLEVARRVVGAISRTHGYAALDSLERLQRGGRAGNAQASPEGPLRLRPILGTRGGEAYLLDRVRSRRQALERLAEAVRELVPIRHLHLSYTTGGGQVQALRDRLADLVDPENLVESGLGPVLATHLGPNAVSVAAMQSLEE